MQSRSLTSLWDVHSSQILKNGERKWCQEECASSLTSLAVNLFWGHAKRTLVPIIVSSDGVSKAPSKQTLFHTHFFTSEWVWKAGDRKKNIQFHKSLHALLCLCNLSSSFHFPLPLTTKLTEAQRFDQSIPISKNTEVLWSDENNLIHALKTRGSVLTHRHMMSTPSPPP